MDNNFLKIINDFTKKKSTIAISVFDLSKGSNFTKYHYNGSLFVYAASLSKIFIAAETLRQVEVGILKLDQEIQIKQVNLVSDIRGIFPCDLNEADLFKTPKSIDFLLKSMLSLSSNSAANELIDLVDRKNINDNIIKRYNWNGSELQRKYLSRDKENQDYKNAPMAKTTSNHVCEFFALVERRKLISRFVSEKLKEYMLETSDKNGTSLMLPEFNNYAHKIGSVKTTLWTYGWLSALKGILLGRRWKIKTWLHDAGIIEVKEKCYAIAVLTYSTQFKQKLFPMKNLSKRIFEFMNDD